MAASLARLRLAGRVRAEQCAPAKAGGHVSAAALQPRSPAADLPLHRPRLSFAHASLDNMAPLCDRDNPRPQHLVHAFTTQTAY